MLSPDGRGASPCGVVGYWQGLVRLAVVVCGAGVLRSRPAVRRSAPRRAGARPPGGPASKMCCPRPVRRAAPAQPAPALAADQQKISARPEGCRPVAGAPPWRRLTEPGQGHAGSPPPPATSTSGARAAGPRYQQYGRSRLPLSQNVAVPTRPHSPQS